MVATTPYSVRYFALADCCQAAELGYVAIRLLVSDTIVILICTVANCGTQVNVAFTFASPMQCQVNEPGDSVSDHHYFFHSVRS